MIRRLALGALALLGLAGAAAAADLPTMKAPPPPPPPAFTWAGFYAGGFLGGGWTDPVNSPDATNPSTVTGLFTFPAGVPMTCDDGTAGLKTGCVAHYGFNPSVVGGVTAGYNWQFGKTVAGLEGEFGYLHMSGAGIIPYQAGAPCGTTANPCSASISTSLGSAFGVLAARLGMTGDAFNPAWAAGDHALFFVKAGAAVTQMATGETCTASATGACYLPIAFSASKDIWGVDLGAGVEWALDQHWSVKAEYDYLGFREPVTACGALPVGVNGQNGVWCTKTGMNGVESVKLGINYHF